MRSLGLRRIMAQLPYSKKGAKTQNYERKDDGTDDFTELPSDLFHPPLAAFVESDHSRHHDLHGMAGGCGNGPLGNGSRHPLRNGGIDPFLGQPVGYVAPSSAKDGDGDTESD